MVKYLGYLAVSLFSVSAGFGLIGYAASQQPATRMYSGIAESSIVALNQYLGDSHRWDNVL